MNFFHLKFEILPHIWCSFTSQISFVIVIGTHEEAIACVHYCPSLGVITTGSWDRTLKIWDPRQHYAVGTYNQLGEQVYTMSLSGERLVVGTSGRRVLVWDLRNMQFAEQRRQSSLKYQTRCIRCFPNKQGKIVMFKNY